MPSRPQLFKKGQSGNPKGRPPKDWTMTSLIREALEESNETKVPRNKIIARKLAELAEKGDMQAIKEINNRLDGMPKQSVEHSGQVVIPILGGHALQSNNSDQEAIEAPKEN